MECRQFGSTKRDVAVIGQGTWYIESGGRASAVAALSRGLDLGMTHIDTAEMYGAAEELVAEAIDGRRDEVFLVSKVLPHHASRHGTIVACDGSLSRLKTDRLDCYLLHWRGDYPLEETFEAFQQLQRDGKILSWGVSNFDAPDLEEARQIVGDSPLVCNQVLYHLQERAIERDAVVRDAWRRRCRLCTVWAWAFSRCSLKGRPSAAGNCRRAQRDPSSGRPTFCHPTSFDVRHPNGVQSRTC